MAYPSSSQPEMVSISILLPAEPWTWGMCRILTKHEVVPFRSLQPYMASLPSIHCDQLYAGHSDLSAGT